MRKRKKDRYSISRYVREESIASDIGGTLVNLVETEILEKIEDNIFLGIEDDTRCEVSTTTWQWRDPIDYIVADIINE